MSKIGEKRKLRLAERLVRLALTNCAFFLKEWKLLEDNWINEVNRRAKYFTAGSPLAFEMVDHVQFIKDCLLQTMRKQKRINEVLIEKIVSHVERTQSLILDKCCREISLNYNPALYPLSKTSIVCERAYQYKIRRQGWHVEVRSKVE